MSTIIIIIVVLLVLVAIIGVIAGIYLKKTKFKSTSSSKKLNLGSVLVVDNDLFASTDCGNAFKSLNANIKKLVKNSTISTITCSGGDKSLSRYTDCDTLIVGNISKLRKDTTSDDGSFSDDDLKTYDEKTNLKPPKPYKNVIFYGDKESMYMLLEDIKPTDIGQYNSVNTSSINTKPIILLSNASKFKNDFESAGFEVEIM